MTQAQLAWYRAMEEAGEMVQIRDAMALDRHVARWTPAAEGGEGAAKPVGFILSLEGADSLATLGHLERAVENGLRVVGPAHYGPGIYANGTTSTGGLHPRGRELLREMDRLGVILDATHLCDDAFWEALGVFAGPVWASHQNCRALVPGDRQWSDDQIRAVLARGGVIGVALDGWMLVPGWERGVTTPESADLRLERLVDHIDHLCQLAGHARQVGIGSDLDGAFGTEQTPRDLGSIADLQSLPGLLAARGYGAADIAGIAHGNFVRFLREAWGRRS
jgi:membrane dipeptidase